MKHSFTFLYPVTKFERNKSTFICNLSIAAEVTERSKSSSFFNVSAFPAIRTEIKSITIEGKEDELLPIIDALTLAEMGSIQEAAETYYNDIIKTP